MKRPYFQKQKLFVWKLPFLLFHFSFKQKSMHLQDFCPNRILTPLSESTQAGVPSLLAPATPGTATEWGMMAASPDLHQEESIIWRKPIFSDPCQPTLTHRCGLSPVQQVITWVPGSAKWEGHQAYPPGPSFRVGGLVGLPDSPALRHLQRMPSSLGCQLYACYFTCTGHRHRQSFTTTRNKISLIFIV